MPRLRGLMLQKMRIALGHLGNEADAVEINRKCIVLEWQRCAHENDVHCASFHTQDRAQIRRSLCQSGDQDEYACTRDECGVCNIVKLFLIEDCVCDGFGLDGQCL